jgi:hypothetical protein
VERRWVPSFLPHCSPNPKANGLLLAYLRTRPTGGMVECQSESLPISWTTRYLHFDGSRVIRHVDRLRPLFGKANSSEVIGAPGGRCITREHLKLR